MEGNASSNSLHTKVNNILIEVLGTIAEQERETIRQRQAESIAAAKENGVYLGRPMIEKPEHWDKVIYQWNSGEITEKKAMSILGLKKSTFYKMLGT